MKIPSLAVLCLALGAPAPAQDVLATVAPMEIHRSSGPIQIDGRLDDAGWKDALRVERWYEFNPGDNVTPPVGGIARLAYDDAFIYVGFEFEDPDPKAIRAPYSDRDNFGSDTDYAGVMLDTRNDGKTALELLANPRGIQFDAVMDDATGNEDLSPDFFWDSAARITDHGWTLEMRIPFSSLRYPKADPATWRILLYRNYPRAYRYQMLHTPFPRGKGCFICNSSSVTGLAGLPRGGSLTVTPYATASRTDTRGETGTRLQRGDFDHGLGADLKWAPTPQVVIDATINPDFSQIESDVAKIGVNERFALSFPEKRPFFLEGVELFTTPITALYTRTITSPRWGLRGTGKIGASAWTALVTEDEGGGSVILPGPLGSDSADQDFHSYVGVGRVRRDIGDSFVGALASVREVQGGGHNRVVGPDFQWRPKTGETLTGQILWSDTRTPVRPELSTEWDGRSLSSLAGQFWYQHSRAKHDAYLEYRDIGQEFRADNGFVPQVGYRFVYGEAGRTFRPQGFLRRIRTFAIFNRSMDRAGDLIDREASAGAGMDGRFNSFARLRVSLSRFRAGAVELDRTQLVYDLQASPSRFVSQLQLVGSVGQQIDFANERTGTGADVSARGTIRPTDHLELRLDASRRWLDVDDGRVFTAQVARLRTTYTFSARSFVRGILQHVGTDRDPRLYRNAVDRRTASLSASALFAYKLNWQTVLFLGYGDERQNEDERAELEPFSRSLFMKVAYALQR